MTTAEELRAGRDFALLLDSLSRSITDNTELIQKEKRNEESTTRG